MPLFLPEFIIVENSITLKTGNAVAVSEWVNLSRRNVRGRAVG